MTRPICVRCQCEMRCIKTGAAILEMMNDDDPYRLWMADVYGCGCGIEVVVGCGRKPIAEHYQYDFTAKVESFSPIYCRNYTKPHPQVYDPTGGTK